MVTQQVNGVAVGLRHLCVCSFHSRYGFPSTADIRMDPGDSGGEGIQRLS